MYRQLLEPISQFLCCATPDKWIDEARKPENLPMLLIDHMICELKAAQTGMWLIRKYVADKPSGNILLEWLKPYEAFIYCREGDLASLAQKNTLSKTLIAKNSAPYSQDLMDKMVLLIKEELHHFYQVLEIMAARGVVYESIPAGRYAKEMVKHVITHEPKMLIDRLICGAYIEARSCERFAKLAPFLDDDLHRFYISLLRSESRHYQDYLTLAEQVAGYDISARVKYFGEIEAELILQPDEQFRFHSGVPI